MKATGTTAAREEAQAQAQAQQADRFFGHFRQRERKKEDSVALQGCI